MTVSPDVPQMRTPGGTTIWPGRGGVRVAMAGEEMPSLKPCVSNSQNSFSDWKRWRETHKVFVALLLARTNLSLDKENFLQRVAEDVFDLIGS